MMQSIEDKIISRIYGRGRGWAFTQNDFKDIAGRSAIDIALYRLHNKDTIRRAIRGVYYYPSIGKLLGKKLPPDTDQIARAIARKFSWRIQITGMSALNYFGLSTQVPGKVTYLSDGPTREYNFTGQSIVFRHTSLKESAFKHRETGLIVQAIKTLGRKRITSEVIYQIRIRTKPSMLKAILKDAQPVSQWILDAIKEICAEISE
ncbi:MAG: hypothetical protein J7K88_11180 [Candidatus Fermentibacteraceae bacterium]|nr:hypothetical protein [Candidatus Fermentibacteraceae bacterium]